MCSDEIHEDLENLCPLAVIGELSEDEQARWDAHVVECGSCRAEYDEYSELLHDKLLLIRPPSRATARSNFRPVDQRELFLARADRRGFIFSDARKIDTAGPSVACLSFFRQPKPALAAILLLSAAIGILSYLLLRATTENRALTSALVESTRDKSSVETQIEQLNQPSPSDQPSPKEGVTGEQAIKKSQSDRNVSAGQLAERALNDARAENESLQSRYDTVEAQLEAATKQLDELNKDTGARQGSKIDVEAELNAAHTSLAKLNEEIRNLRDARSNDLSRITVQEFQVKELSDRLRDQTEALNRERRLLAADRDIRELMTARNLHIVDVYDVDEKGKTRRTFGRAFYTEGRSLIFYAFDLEDTRITKAKYSLQAWGYQQSTDRSVQSLGIFYVDDQKKNRWALKFDDPAVLAQIDSVFVTIEPPGGSKRPSGEKLLYAYLKNQPNHP